jgi:F420-non-reducing hydrogenase large subunit
LGRRPAAGNQVDGRLNHDYSRDENGLITWANMIVGAAHNLGSINMSVHQAAKTLISGGHVDEGILNRVEMAVRAYNP